ncbi:MAG TPA: hypothetical protein VHZ29_09135 [Rhizomicrobium sp.]|jgi:FkbH-like protein|nr:hypothetical protein [Rhizomicrobium sp.]
MIANMVKLVVWDLDDTFWQGTLGEGDVVAIGRNLEIVRELARRGIPSAICSKNDFGQARATLAEFGVWEFFVFAQIAFHPKGQAIAELIAAAALRPQNVLFLDDNAANLEEARFFNPGIMTADPGDALDTLLDRPQLKGKPDAGLTQLEKYRLLERKHAERRAGALSNEAFLRASHVKVEIGYDVEKDFDRVVELVNRANQLNYTKRRLDTPESIDTFRARLRGFSIHAGTVSAADDYGDYGLIGFFMLRQRAFGKRLIHFVFSCRTMHMGIEQYVYEKLGCPEIDIAGPVAYGLQSHASVDWIEAPDETARTGTPSRPLVLLGGCDLLQLAVYCSTDRLEFVNVCRDGTVVRYDDPGFVLSDRAAISDCAILRGIPAWQYEERLRFDAALASSEMVLVSMWAAMTGTYFRTEAGVLLRVIAKQRQFLNDGIERGQAAEVPLDDPQRLELIAKAFDAIAERGTGTIFALGCNTRNGSNLRRRREYNDSCRAYCARSGARFHFVDVDAVVPDEYLLDEVHFSRAGYHALARHILDVARVSG